MFKYTFSKVRTNKIWVKRNVAVLPPLISLSVCLVWSALFLFSLSVVRAHTMRHACSNLMRVPSARVQLIPPSFVSVFTVYITFPFYFTAPLIQFLYLFPFMVLMYRIMVVSCKCTATAAAAAVASARVGRVRDTKHCFCWLKILRRINEIIKCNNWYLKFRNSSIVTTIWSDNF